MMPNIISCIPLYCPCNVELVEVLFNAGVKKDLKDEKGRTALLHAVRNDNVAVAKVLIREGADKEIMDAEDDTALILAIKRGNIEMEEVLLQ